jgi:hypothetical protein
VKLQILLTASPSDGKPRVVLDIFDTDAPVGRQTVWSLATFLERPVETRAEWAKTYAHYVLHEVAQLVAVELDRGRDVQVLPAVSDGETAPGEVEVKTSPRWQG